MDNLKLKVERACVFVYMYVMRYCKCKWTKYGKCHSIEKECQMNVNTWCGRMGRMEWERTDLGWVYLLKTRDSIGFICVTISYRIAFVRHTFLICLMVINLGFMLTHTLRTNFGFSFHEICVRICIKCCLFNRRITDSFSTVRFKWIITK